MVGTLGDSSHGGYVKQPYIYAFSDFSSLLSACAYIARDAFVGGGELYYERIHNAYRYYLLLYQNPYKATGEVYPHGVIAEYADRDRRCRTENFTAYLREHCERINAPRLISLLASLR